MFAQKYSTVTAVSVKKAAKETQTDGEENNFKQQVFVISNLTHIERIALTGSDDNIIERKLYRVEIVSWSRLSLGKV